MAFHGVNKTKPWRPNCRRCDVVVRFWQFFVSIRSARMHFWSKGEYYRVQCWSVCVSLQKRGSIKSRQCILHRMTCQPILSKCAFDKENSCKCDGKTKNQKEKKIQYFVYTIKWSESMLKKVSMAGAATMTAIPSPKAKACCTQFDVGGAIAAPQRNPTQKDGSYQWLNTPKAIYHNRKMTNEHHPWVLEIISVCEIDRQFIARRRHHTQCRKRHMPEPIS